MDLYGQFVHLLFNIGFFVSNYFAQNTPIQRFDFYLKNNLSIIKY